MGRRILQCSSVGNGKAFLPISSTAERGSGRPAPPTLSGKRGEKGKRGRFIIFSPARKTFLVCRRNGDKRGALTPNREKGRRIDIRSRETAKKFFGSSYWFRKRKDRF